MSTLPSPYPRRARTRPSHRSSFRRARRTPRRAAQLADHDAVVPRATAGEARWELTGPRGDERIDLRARVVGDHVGFLVEAAAAGLGIALLPTFLADPLVADGRLVHVLPKYSAEIQLHLLAPPARHVPHRVAIVRDYLATRLLHVCSGHAPPSPPSLPSG